MREKIKTKKEFQDLARKDFKYFITYTSPWYIFQPFHLMIIDKLQQLIDGTILQLKISLPPRAGKSQLCSRFLPAFLLGYELTNKDSILLGSFDKTLSGDFGKDVKKLMKLEAYRELFPDVDLIGRSDVGSYFSTTCGGDFRGVGVNSATTGRDGTWLIADDTLADDKEASKRDNLIKLHNWWTTVFEARETVSKAGNEPRKLVLSTRWAEEDLIGWLNKNEPDKWHYLNIPALAESEDDILGRKIDESLWEGNAALRAEKLILKRNRNPVSFAKVFQGKPASEKGNFFNRNKINFITPEEIPPNKTHFYVSIAGPQFKNMDEIESCITIWQRTPGNDVYLIRSIRKKLDAGGLFNLTMDLKDQYPVSATIYDSSDLGTAVWSLARKQGSRTRPLRVRDTALQSINKAKLALESPKIKITLFDNVSEQLQGYPTAMDDDIVRSICNFINWYSTKVYLGDFRLGGSSISRSIKGLKSKTPRKFGVVDRHGSPRWL